jgi:hypothetical protein
MELELLLFFARESERPARVFYDAVLRHELRCDHPSPPPAWPRSEPSDRCKFDYHTGKCVPPTAYTRSRDFMQPSRILRSRGL